VSKPRKPGRKVSAHTWGMTQQAAFDRIADAVGTLELAEKIINEGLRSGQLNSREWQISPDGEATWKALNISDWAQRTVRVRRSIFFPGIIPGMTASPPQRAEASVYIEGPQFAGHVFIRRADLDKYYPTAALPTTTQPDKAGPPERRREQATSKYDRAADAAGTPKRRMSLLQEMLEASLRHCYPQDVPPNTSTSAVRRTITAAWEAECQRRGLKPSEPPSLDTINRKLGRRRR